MATRKPREYKIVTTKSGLQVRFTKWTSKDGKRSGLKLEPDNVPTGAWAKHADTCHKSWQKNQDDIEAFSQFVAGELGEGFGIDYKFGKVQLTTGNKSAAHAEDKEESIAVDTLIACFS